MILDNRIDDVLSRVTIAQIFQSLGVPVPVRNRSACPICHVTKNKTAFSVNERKGVWKCFAGDHGGGKIDLVMALSNMDKRTALHWLADLAGVDMSDPVLESEKQQFLARAEAVKTGRAVKAMVESALASLNLYRLAIESMMYRVERYLHHFNPLLTLDHGPSYDDSLEFWFALNSERSWVENGINHIEAAEGKALLAVYREIKRHPDTTLTRNPRFTHLIDMFVQQQSDDIKSTAAAMAREATALRTLGFKF